MRDLLCIKVLAVLALVGIAVLRSEPVQAWAGAQLYGF